MSASMTDAELPVSPRTLHYLIKRAGADAHALDRTVYKIKKYVARMKGNAALSKRDRMNGRGVR